MKKKYSWSIIALFGMCMVFMLGNTVPSFAVEEDACMPRVSFAEFLIRTIGIELPAGTEDLPEEEYFEVVANILAENGINNFVETDPRAIITCGELADIIYALLGIEETRTTRGKLLYLIENGHMSQSPMNRCVTLAYATEVLNNPLFSDLVAEAFPFIGISMVAEDAPGFKLEDTPDEAAVTSGTTPLTDI